MKRVLQKLAKEASYPLFMLSLRSLRASVGILLFFTLVLPSLAGAEPSARIEVPESTAWTGQRVPFFIELRAAGSFTGAASFDIPEVPGTFILKIGTPVLGSLVEADTEYFTQRHEFALFSQADGTVTLPPITTRFSHRRGYTGPSFEASLQTPATRLTIKRPPGSETLGFLVTTPDLEIEESWDPAPGPSETGAVLKRTIVQRASGMTGMALAPMPTDAPEGIRVYTDEPVIQDRTKRGEFSCERRETLTYLVQQAGTHTLPALRYDWWNPKTETLESKTLPAITFSATVPPPPPPKPSPWRHLSWALPIALACLAFLFRSTLLAGFRALRDHLDPPKRRLQRRFIKACHRNDPRAAAEAWNRCRRHYPEASSSPPFETALTELYSHLYGQGESIAWNGRHLADAFEKASLSSKPYRSTSPLPLLNP